MGERIVVLAGGIAVLIAGIDISRRSLARLELREEKIQERRRTLADLRHVASPVDLEGTVPRALGGRTSYEAASELRTLLRGYASAARIEISRIDIPATPLDPGTTNAIPVIPASLAGSGSIAAVAELLRSVQSGPRVLEVTGMLISRDSVDGGRPLRLTLTVRGPWIARQ